MNIRNSEISGNFYGSTSTGSVSLYLYNVKYLSNLGMWINSSTGDVYMYIYQYISMLNDVDVYLSTSTGSVYADFDGNDTITGAQFISSVSTGDFYYTNSEGFTQTSSLFESSGYDDALNKYQLTQVVSIGNIYVMGKSI
ncbi:MAG: hypothetical protein ACTSWY_14805 [Promethearchaeota archaeon]